MIVFTLLRKTNREDSEIHGVFPALDAAVDAAASSTRKLESDQYWTVEAHTLGAFDDVRGGGGRLAALIDADGHVTRYEDTAPDATPAEERVLDVLAPLIHRWWGYSEEGHAAGPDAIRGELRADAQRLIAAAIGR
jgi:hypothetical protein